MTRALLSSGKLDISGFKKLDEVPYDFIRKRLSILVSKDGGRMVVTKGAFSSILNVCTKARLAGGIVEISQVNDALQQEFAALSWQGLRVLGLSCRTVKSNTCLARDEADMTFLGFLVFFDPPKKGIPETISDLAGLGVCLKSSPAIIVWRLPASLCRWD